ncbi:MAG: ATP-grasp domain-containing protein [Acidimicrobiia bacterium]|nr:ATP-grasp domain-containing protein [Acidimicrobiia bacterium]
MTEPTLLVLGCSAQQLPVIDAAHQRGLRVVGIDPDPEAAGATVVDSFVVADLGDHEACLATAMRARPAGVLTFAADYPVPMVARIAEQLNLVGPSQATARAMTDKLAMRSRLAAAGLATPRFAPVTGPDDVAVFGRPAVIKPTQASGSRGVAAVDGRDPSSLIDAARAESADGKALIEEYVPGPEVSIEAVTIGGRTTILAMTDKLTSGPPDFVELGHTQPSRLTERSGELAALTTKTLCALGLRSGPSHTEIRLGPRGPVVIEAAARFGGGCIASHLLPIAAHIQAADVAVTMALGGTGQVEPSIGGGAAVRFLTPRGGVVRSIAGLDEVRGWSGVVEAVVEVAVGDRVGPMRSARDRVGYVVASGPTAAEAGLLADRAAASITIETSPRS